MDNFYLTDYDKKKFMKIKSGVLLLFPKFHYSFFLPEFSACAIEYVNILIKYFNSGKIQTCIYEYYGKKIIHIDDIYYNNISIIIIKALERILRLGMISESSLTDYNSIDINVAKKQFKTLCDNLGGLNPNRIINTELLN
jgi:hypothetical protein